MRHAPSLRPCAIAELRSSALLTARIARDGETTCHVSSLTKRAAPPPVRTTTPPSWRTAMAAGAARRVAPGAARLPARSERVALPVPRVPRRNLLPRAAAAADGADHSSPTIGVRVRLSGAAGPAGDLVVCDVDPHATTPRVLVARWAAELGFSAAPCTAVARADRAGADEVRLKNLDVTLSAAGVADGGVVLVELAPGCKLITLRMSADKACTVPLHGADGMATMLRRYNAVALRKVVGAASPPPQVTEVFNFEWLESGATYAPVPRAPRASPAVRNVKLSCELLPPDADGAPHPPLVFADLTNGALDSLLHDLRAAGVSTTRLPPHTLLRDVANLADGASYYVVPLASGGMGEIDTLNQQARGALGAKRSLRGSVGALVGLQHLLTPLCCPNRPAATAHRPNFRHAGFKLHRSQHQPGHRPGAGGRRVRAWHR